MILLTVAIYCNILHLAPLYIQEPVERILGRSELVNGRVVDISDCCYEVDLLVSLQQQLSTRTVLEQVAMHAHMYTQIVKYSSMRQLHQ